MSAPQTQIGSTFSVANLHFQKTDIANANGDASTIQADSTAYVAPYKGSIIGVSSIANGTLVTGTITPYATINGSVCPSFPDAAAVRANQQYGHYTQNARKDNFTFNAGDRIGLSYTKAGTVAPTTRDGVFLLVVLYEDVRY